ncbi:MAG: Uma2 family endonuclease [Umezawaea sp.]
MELGETERGYTELYEGHLLVWPSQSVRHSIATLNLAFQLDPQLPDDLHIVLATDVDLQLAKPDEPGFVRRPDLVVMRNTAGDRVDEECGLLRASDIVLVVEVVEPHSRRTDFVVKRADYADAGIPGYWVIDLEPLVSLTPYRDAPAVTREFITTAPFPLTVRVDTLLD